MSSPLPSSSLASLVMDKIALGAKEGASQYFPSCEFSFFEGLIQRKRGRGEGGKSRTSEFIPAPYLACEFCTLTGMNRAMKQVTHPPYSTFAGNSVSVGASPP